MAETVVTAEQGSQAWAAVPSLQNFRPCMVAELALTVIWFSCFVQKHAILRGCITSRPIRVQLCFRNLRS